jgi:hypothetical protein
MVYSSKRLQMGDQPKHRRDKRNHQYDEDDSPFTPFFAHGAARAPTSRLVTIAFVLQSHSDIKPSGTLAGSRKQFLALLPRYLLGYTGRLLDHSFKPFHFFAERGFAADEIFFRLIKR